MFSFYDSREPIIIFNKTLKSVASGLPWHKVGKYARATAERGLGTQWLTRRGCQSPARWLTRVPSFLPVHGGGGGGATVNCPDPWTPRQGIEQVLGSCQHLGTPLVPLAPSVSRSLTHTHGGVQETLPYRGVVLCPPHMHLHAHTSRI